MIKSLLIDQNEVSINSLKNQIHQNCPQLETCGFTRTIEKSLKFIHAEKPDLVFLNPNLNNENGFKILENLPIELFELIVVADSDKYTLQSFRFSPIEYLLNPISTDRLISAVKEAEKRISKKKKVKRDRKILEELISNTIIKQLRIPTGKGLEFISIQKIIRLEGLQRYTRIFIEGAKSIVSSKNLGEFRDQLKSYGFLSIHRSHIINLQHIRRYNNEGTVTMIDDTHIPVSRRKKHEFLEELEKY